MTNDVILSKEEFASKKLPHFFRTPNGKKLSPYTFNLNTSNRLINVAIPFFRLLEERTSMKVKLRFFNIDDIGGVEDFTGILPGKHDIDVEFDK